MSKAFAWFHIAGRLWALFAAGTGVVAVSMTILFFGFVNQLPRVPEPLRRIIDIAPTEIFAANGERVYQVGGRTYVTMNQISPQLVSAILAVEDHRFWDHQGINILRTIKALWITLFSDGRVQGASTITQQLAKNLFFSFEQTYERKFKELLVALQIESQFSKQDILEAYLNQIYFGPGAQGVEAAARRFFGKSASQLNLAESSLLAGLLKSPTRYNPLRYADRAKTRQRIVLQRMVVTGSVSQVVAEAAFQEPLTFQERPDNGSYGGYFVDWVLNTLEERYGAQVVYHGGLKVTTTIDLQLQRIAEESMRKGLRDLDLQMALVHDQAADKNTQHLPQGALVAVQVNSGAVKALVGGRDYAATEFNRAISNNRQPGSGFKPFLYYAAFEALDLNPASVVIDQPVNIPVAGSPDWRPRNFKQTYAGPVILKRAFTESINTIAAQLVAQLGPQAVIDVAARCGIRSPLSPVYSVALGTSGVSPLEMASAYATFATGGIQYPPFAIWRVEDSLGQVLEEHIVSGQRVLDAVTAYQVVDLMQGVIEQGTGRVVRKMGLVKPAAGKTGTTNGYKDAWFTGFTPTLSTSVWVGFDRDVGLKDRYKSGITGGRGAAPIWTQFTLRATESDPHRTFIQPSGIRFSTRHATTGEVVAPGHAEAVRVALPGFSFGNGDRLRENTP